MEREEERSNAAEQYVEGFHSAIKRMCKECFVDGAKWADENHHKGLWDSEKVCEFLQDRIAHTSIAYLMTTKYLIEDLKKAMKNEEYE